MIKDCDQRTEESDEAMVELRSIITGVADAREEKAVG